MTEKPIVPREIRTIFQGRVFTLRIETIPLPKGGELQAEIIRHPGSVVIIPITAQDEIILVRQYRPAIGRWAWELPAGSLKPGEDVERAARRECHEETAQVPSHLERLGSFFPTPGYCDEEMTFFKATGLRPPGPGDEEAHQDEDEDIEVRPFGRDQLQRMIVSGAVIDLKTIAGLSLISREMSPGSSPRSTVVNSER
jgi:ADP-ribose pyrophosphatase